LLGRPEQPELELDGRVTLAERGQQPREDVQLRGRHVSDDQLPDFPTSRPARGLGRTVRLGQRQPCFNEEGTAGVRELDSTARAMEETHSEVALEPTNLLTERRLGNMQAPRRSTEVQLFRDGDEVAKVTKLHARNDIAIVSIGARPKYWTAGERVPYDPIAQEGTVDPSRFLVAMFQGGGNIPLLLPIMRRLAALGHHLRFIVGPGVRRSRLPVGEPLYRSLRGIGDVLRLREPDVHPLDVAPTVRGVALGWVPRAFRSVAAEARVARWIPHWAQEVACQLEREPADVLVADFVLVGALVAAEAAGVASVALVHTLYPRPAAGRPPYGPGWMPAVGIADELRDAVGTFISNRIYAREALPFVNFARRKRGLRPIRRYFEQYDRASRVVVLTSPHFDPEAGFLPNVRLVGTPLVDADSPPGLPPLDPKDGRPLVLVSLSTLEQGQAVVMERILAALGGLPVRALVTLGPALASSRFTPPPNVVMETFVPHGSVLPRAAAIVTQCGLGTLMKALAHGVPLVCIPLVGDQPENASRIETLRAGVRLPPDADARRIRAAIERVLTDPTYRLAAQRVASAIAGEEPVHAAVDEIESVIPSAARCTR
jgi:UDP:flavonoid glycosyltransferase YjiC (YdhE family)